MTRRTKTLIAAIVIIFFWLPFYMAVTWLFVAPILAPAPWYISMLFYPLAGMLWIVPIGLALPWMYRETGKK
jgi:TRAP-type mannitol/chloroaromatic compound transport system permease small subunit